MCVRFNKRINWTPLDYYCYYGIVNPTLRLKNTWKFKNVIRISEIHLRTHYVSHWNTSELRLIPYSFSKFILEMRNLKIFKDAFPKISNMIFNQTTTSMIKLHNKFFSKPLEKTFPFSINFFTPKLQSCVSWHQKEQKKTRIQGKDRLFNSLLLTLILFCSWKNYAVSRNVSEFYMNSFRSAFSEFVCFHFSPVCFTAEKVMLSLEMFLNSVWIPPEVVSEVCMFSFSACLFSFSNCLWIFLCCLH